MKKLTLETAELLAMQLRNRLGTGANEPLSMKTVMRQLNVMAIYRPLSDKLFGLSLKSGEGDMFILINSNSTRGRQHFTIAHELFHLIYDEKPSAHFCEGRADMSDLAERSANMFASALLMPHDGLLNNILPEEIVAKKIGIDTAIRLGQLYGVSHSTLVLRLKELKLISQLQADELFSISVRKEAYLRGFDRSLYEAGNHGLVIGDFGSNARKLYDAGAISEGHYMELLNMIGYGGESEDSAGR